jgi:hypothetical protein
MLDSRPARALALQVGLLVWGGRLVGTVDSRGLPTEYSLAAAPDRYAGEEVVVTAEVVTTDPLVGSGSFRDRDVRVTVVDATWTPRWATSCGCTAWSSRRATPAPGPRRPSGR